jgi:nucleoside 2-deoxyribosyltransferase
MKTFLICPVRGHSMAETEAIVELLERDGWEVHWPPRDTNQDDPAGYQICCDNLAAITVADAVHVVWDGQSQGCLFDLGMAFALKKRIIPIQLPAPSTGKSFQNMVREWYTITELTTDGDWDEAAQNRDRN